MRIIFIHPRLQSKRICPYSMLEVWVSGRGIFNCSRGIQTNFWCEKLLLMIDFIPMSKVLHVGMCMIAHVPSRHYSNTLSFNMGP